ncbi:amidophosphoribosyltransferase [Sagittula salina]|uniref:Amidophosphoribosyltransferase n=1 Tax=Sagittula salina TaxID=2820268 RepID=A0A940MKC7_9RHOB|nr:amidophosphoribosyltransferase [Sagittula salina]MBP0480954.1 amidophosphoribosyltransferase [Sagittula salina]
MAQDQTPASVAKAATQTSAAPLNGLILLGTFGADKRPNALVRTSRGEVVQLKIGDRIGASPIIAIETGRLAYARNGRTTWLTQPAN